MTDSDASRGPPTTRDEPESATLDLPAHQRPLIEGQVLGERYEIRGRLGRGGMGEVWHAFDLKLRVEVALKALRTDLFKSEQRRETLRQEVRAAREVVSPNVCRVFDLEEIDGRELVSMEYVNGATLLAVLHERGPLELKEAQDIASQFLAGLEAIHKVGLVHRDIKPENIMLTRAGRVVVMDFGIARQEAEGGGSVSGTPAYMSPEQAGGETLDARADVYSAGVVLAEMVCPDGIKNIQSRQSVWEGVRSEPAKVPDTPWAQVIQKAVAKDREGRFKTAHTLTRALEDVTLRVEGAEDLHPYPGLASFTEDDAEYFFGREAEVEQMWRKLEGPPRMLALVGPSGAGKSSFLRAGLVAGGSASWSHVVCTPGSDPCASLRRALIPELEGDPESLKDLASGDDDATTAAAGRWRGRTGHALLIVDQFEELFTQNPDHEQQRFAALLGRLVLEADVSVMLAMRDDFLIHCNRHEQLQPLFSELTPLDPPTGPALRRALTQPALQCGYRFEDDELVDEMLAEVEGERGALPLLAFAAARLWEKRDRDTGLLTRQAYQDIGGVVGALAKHAEATIDRVGADRIATVRELFRNLVTAEGTRAIREWDELLSVFEESGREPAAAVLRELIDARLLTSYEVREDEHEPIRRVEIIHESLLANWPRLVRWQTQDADSAQLRDQLRQAARTWNDQGRSDDTLWTGAAYREFASWRERYPGGLTEVEEAFARAMVAYARRHTRRRRVAVGAAFCLLTLVLVVVGISRQKAIDEANRAEASKLLAIAQAELPKYRTDALAYTIASLKRHDSSEARRFALETLWDGPMVTVVDDRGEEPWGIAFSRDGRFLAAGDWNGGVRVFRSDGAALDQLHFGAAGIVGSVGFTLDDSHLVATVNKQTSGAPSWETRIWTAGSWSHLNTLQSYCLGIIRGNDPRDHGANAFITGEVDTRNSESRGGLRGLVRRWSSDGQHSKELGSILLSTGPTTHRPNIDRSGTLLALFVSKEIRLHRLDGTEAGPHRVIGRHPTFFDRNARPVFDPASETVAACDVDGNLLFWPVNGDGNSPSRRIQGPPGSQHWSGFDPNGSHLAISGMEEGAWIWDVVGLPDAEPIVLKSRGPQMSQGDFHPSGRVLATSGGGYGVAFWNLGPHWSRVLPESESRARQLAFSPDGRHLYTCNWADSRVMRWPLTASHLADKQRLFEPSNLWGWGIEADPTGQFVVSMRRSESWLIPVAGGEPRILEDLPATPYGPRIDRTGRIIASSQWANGPTRSVVALDILTGRQWVLDSGDSDVVTGVDFDPSGRIVLARGRNLYRWDYVADEIDLILENLPEPRGSIQVSVTGSDLALSPNGRYGLYVTEEHSTVLVDIESRHARLVPHLAPCNSTTFDPSGELAVCGGTDGVIRVGQVDGDRTYLMYGHEGPVNDVKISPDGARIASVGQDGTLQLWPMPDLSKPPLQSLPYEQLLATLEGLTNLRAIADPDAPNGYRIAADPDAYRGWSEAPKW